MEMRWTKKTVSFKMIASWCQLKIKSRAQPGAPSYSFLNRRYEQHLLYKFTSVGANVMAFNAARICC